MSRWRWWRSAEVSWLSGAQTELTPPPSCLLHANVWTSASNEIKSMSSLQLLSVHPSSCCVLFIQQRRTMSVLLMVRTTLITVISTARLTDHSNYPSRNAGRSYTRTFFSENASALTGIIFESVNIWQSLSNSVVVSCTLRAWPAHCLNTKKVHGTITFLLVTLPNIYRFNKKSPTGSAINLS